MTKTLLLFALLGASAAHADPLKIALDLATPEWHPNKPVEVTLMVTNSSKAAVTFQVMSCSWDEHWKSSDPELSWARWDCDKNAPSTVSLAPGKAREWKLSMLAGEHAALGAHSLAMTFTPRNGTPVTSSEVTITVKR